MDLYDFKLHDELNDWREKQMVEEGLGLDDFFGPQLLLSDDILDRIVDLHHHSKVHDVQSLIDQTGWHYASRYGTQILEIVKSCTRLVPPRPSVALPVLHDVAVELNGAAVSGDVLLGSSSQTSDKVTGRQCKACGATTHIGESIIKIECRLID